MGTQGVLRMVTEASELIVTPINHLLRFRGKVGLQDQVEMVAASSPIALNTLVYIAEHFSEIKSVGSLKIFRRNPPDDTQRTA